ncbi:MULTISPECIES: hypothetical protein [unclassified Saccharothrix]|uniref:hypothetical protein n=1 Tax=unclassified Saccharothrix TaxID=2593673 RepID=UPI00307F3147
MVSGSRAERGSIGGSAGDSGVEYRRGVAAYAVALGLARTPLPGFGVPADQAQVGAVVVETDEAVDDVRIDLCSGWKVSVQAKRSLRKKETLGKAVAQWVAAGKAGVTPSRERLVIVAGALSGPMRALAAVLERNRLAHPGAPTAAEAEILGHVEELMAELDADQRDAVLRCAVIRELAVEETDHADSQTAIAHLRDVVPGRDAVAARRTWKALIDVAGRAARLRGGWHLDGWQAALEAEGVILTRDAAACDAAVVEAAPHTGTGVARRTRRRLVTVLALTVAAVLTVAGHQTWRHADESGSRPPAPWSCARVNAASAELFERPGDAEPLGVKLRGARIELADEDVQGPDGRYYRLVRAPKRTPTNVAYMLRDSLELTAC